MKDFYPFANVLEPIFNRYGYNISLKSKLNIVALHKDYYVANRSWILKLNDYLTYIADLKFGKNELYIEKTQIEEDLKWEFLNTIQNKIWMLLLPEEIYETIKIKVAEVFMYAENEVRIQLAEVTDHDPHEEILEYAKKMTENLQSFSKIKRLTRDFFVEHGKNETIFAIDIEENLIRRLSSICTMIIKMQAMLFHEMYYKNHFDGDGELRKLFLATEITINKLSILILQNKHILEDFKDYQAWMFLQTINRSNSVSEEEYNLKDEIAKVVKEFYYKDFNSVIEDLRTYSDLYEIDNDKKEKLANTLRELLNTEKKESWKEMLTEVYVCQKEICLPVFSIVHFYFYERIGELIRKGVNGTPIDTKAKEILLLYYQRLCEQFDNLKDKANGISTFDKIKKSVDKRNFKREIVDNGINYSLAAQYVYANLTGNIMCHKVLGTKLTQKEGAAIYDILKALGFTGPKTDEYIEKINKQKAKFYAVNAAFKEGSGGYNIKTENKGNQKHRKKQY